VKEYPNKPLKEALVEKLEVAVFAASSLNPLTRHPKEVFTMAQPLYLSIT
jgi:hypothetical protein